MQYIKEKKWKKYKIGGERGRDGGREREKKVQ